MTEHSSQEPAPKRRMGLAKRLALLFLWLLLLGAGALAWDARVFLTTPASTVPQEVTITIQPGATFDRVAWDLKKAGAITDVTRFRLLAMWRKALGSVKAGEFVVSTGWTPDEILLQITKGQAVLYRLSLREGLTWWETARAVEEQGFARYEDFKAVIHDPAFLREHNIPFADAEGFLFPETYLLKKPRTPLDREQAEEIASLLARMFWKRTEKLWAQLPVRQGGNTLPAVSSTNATARAGANATSGQAARGRATNATPSPAAENTPQRPATPADVDPDALKNWLILATLVEKETAVPAERARVAGVYANRLRLGMLLQCDPTIIYGVGPSFKGAIRRSQLSDASNLYNTYQHPGLPPGPICSPGYEALAAALTPEKHNYLYFVATGVNGGHTFSKSGGEHVRAVQAYRAHQAAARAGGGNKNATQEEPVEASPQAPAAEGGASGSPPLPAPAPAGQ